MGEDPIDWHLGVVVDVNVSSDQIGQFISSAGVWINMGEESPGGYTFFQPHRDSWVYASEVWTGEAVL